MLDTQVIWDTLLVGGRVIDPRNAIDGWMDVAICKGKICEIGKDLAKDMAREIYDVTGKILVPGLIDLHTHIYHKATAYGVDPDPIARRSGAITLVDAGSAGAGNFAGLRDFVFSRSTYRLLAYINISYPGIFAFARDYSVGEASYKDLLSVDHCVEAIEHNREIVVGVKVRLGAATSGDIGLLALDRAIDAAERTGLPVMTHIGKPPPTYSEILDRLRPGDILTHCYRPAPNAPVGDDQTVLSALKTARSRGIIFDIGHGMGAFGFASAESAIDQGFLPDVISSDVHGLSVDGPAFDLLHTMSKLLNCKIPLKDVIAMATSNPAQAMRRDDIGHLGKGTIADISLIETVDIDIPLSDVQGVVRQSATMLRATDTFIAGKFTPTDRQPWELRRHLW